MRSCLNDPLNPLRMIAVAFTLFRFGTTEMKRVVEFEFKWNQIDLLTDAFLWDTHHLCNAAQVVLKELVQTLGQFFLVQC